MLLYKRGDRMDVNIGHRVRLLRKSKNMSIAKLSEMSGVSTGLISQIERELVSPSVVNLWKLAQTLDKNIGYFFDEGIKENDIVVRKDERKKLIINKSRAKYEILTPNSNEKIEFFMITIGSGDESNIDMLEHDGEECGLVLKGTLTVKINDDEYTLYEGDSIYFSSEMPHRYLNKHDGDCVSVWAMTPPSF